MNLSFLHPAYKRSTDIEATLVIIKSKEEMDMIQLKYHEYNSNTCTFLVNPSCL